jgi:hypothetical protein
VNIAGGDEIQIGSSTIKLMVVKNSSAKASTVPLLAEPKPAPGQGILMTGSMADVALPDLIQLFMNSRKSGVLTLFEDQRLGRIYLREGRVYHASVDGDVVLAQRKAFYRMLRWMRGRFELTPPIDHGPVVPGPPAT